MERYEKAWPWLLFCSVVPIIGPAILYAAKKSINPGLARVAKWLLLVQIVAIIGEGVALAYTTLWILAGAAIVTAIVWIVVMFWRYFAEKDNVYRAWYLFFAIPVIGYILAMVTSAPGEVKKDITILFAIYIAIGILLAILAMIVAVAGLTAKVVVKSA